MNSITMNRAFWQPMSYQKPISYQMVKNMNTIVKIKKGKHDFDIGSGSSNNISERYYISYGDRRIRNEIHSVM